MPNRQARRAQLSEARKHLRRENALYGTGFREVPRAEWPADIPEGLTAVFRSRYLLAQIYAADLPAVARISFCRTEVNGSGHWRDGIPWETLQAAKNALGFENFDAVEVYPRGGDEVAACNIRHLWILGEPLGFVWRS